jgi:hypothetical protein
LREELAPGRDPLGGVERVRAEAPETDGRLARAEAVLEVRAEVRGDGRDVPTPWLGFGRLAQSSSAETARGNWSSRT